MGDYFDKLLQPGQEEMNDVKHGQAEKEDEKHSAKLPSAAVMQMGPNLLLHQSVTDNINGVQGGQFKEDQEAGLMRQFMIQDEKIAEGKKNMKVMCPPLKTYIAKMQGAKPDTKTKLRKNTEKKLEENIVKLRDSGELPHIVKHLKDWEDGASCISAEVIGAFEQLSKNVTAYQEGDRIALSVCSDLMLRVSEALRGYEESHNKMVWFSGGGEMRKKLFAEAAKFFKPFSEEISKYFAPSEEEKYVSEYTEEEKKRAERHIDRFMDKDGLTENILRHWKYIGKNTLDSPEERIRRKLLITDAFKRDLMVYRSAHRDNMPAKLQKFYAKYDELIKEKKYIEWVKKNMNGELEKDDVTAEISREAHARAERTEEKRDYGKNSNIDKGLSRKQIDAIERIDRWFLRNFNNGGLSGKFLTFMKYGCVDIVNELMMRSKRERLHIYYLIETNARKNASFMDAGFSQSEEAYVPSLKALKGRMLASKLKIKAHFTGSYVYWHKLSEAMNITDQYRDIIRSMGEMEEASQKKGEEKKEEEKTAAEKREEALVKLYGSLTNYSKTLSKIKTAGRKERKELEAEAKGQAQAAENNLRELVEYDNAVAESLKGNKVLNRDSDKAIDAYSHAGFDAMIGGSASSYSTIYSWGLKGMDFAKMKLYTTDTGSALATASALLVVVANIHSLAAGWSHTSSSVKMSLGLDALKSAADTAKTVWWSIENSQFLRENLADVTKEAFRTSSTYTLVSYAAGGVTAVAGAAKGMLEMHRSRKTKSAAHAMAQIREEKLKNAKDDAEVAEIKKQEKYEKSMLEIAKLTHTRKKTSAAGMVVTGAFSIAATATVTVPVLGMVLSLTALGVGVVAGMIDAVQYGSAQTGFFDSYIGLDHIVETAKAKMREQGRPIGNEAEFRALVSRRAAAALGFADVASACDQLAKNSADFILSKLFEEGLSEEEKKPYIDALKGFGLKYRPSDDIKKRRPKRLALAKAISGR